MLSGVQNSINRVFTTPDFFLATHFEVFHNGRRLTELVGTAGDYTLSESGGVGTGFDTVTFISFKPKPNSVLRANYVTP